MLTAHDGAVETIAGVSVLRFDARGLVVEQRDTWAADSGALVPPAWASRADG